MVEPVSDPVGDAHQAMRQHLPEPGSPRWCRCGERWPCVPRRDARSLLIQCGHIVLKGGRLS
jgi:hypothetical protein